MKRHYRELQKYEVIKYIFAWGVVAVDKDDEVFLIREFDKRTDAERHAEHLNRKIKARNGAKASS